MTDFKLSIGHPKTGKTYKKELTGDLAEHVLGKRLGERLDGKSIGFDGYEFEITGGSDHAGFPLRKGIVGDQRKKILARRSVGVSGRDRWKNIQKGLKVKKTVCGRRIGKKTTQVNLKVLKAGNIELLEPKKEEPEQKAEEKASSSN